MSQPLGGPRSDRALDRVVTFSDGVVAIAITLLVLPLLDLAADGGDFERLMSTAWPRVIAFVVSFAVVANFWLVHHRVLSGIVAVSGPLIWANMLWLATIAFLPFPTEVLGVRDSSEMGVRALYIGSVAACSFALALIDVVILRDPTLWPDGERPDIDLVHIATILGVMVVAFVLGVFVEPIGMWS
ncbi:MAG: DUF1211 domain-containing protein, partial [Actinobacteria bacterium]|nr:DUF1211 domain-containing protein [Actinomycetota bacterium]